VDTQSSTLLLVSSRHPTNILDQVTETINNRTEPVPETYPSVQASCVAFGFTVSQLRNTMSLQLQSRGRALIESKHYMCRLCPEKLVNPSGFSFVCNIF
jgi:hypothetical protein